MLLIMTVVVLLLLWVIGRFQIWGFDAQPILMIFAVIALLLQLVFRARVRYR